MNLISTTGLPYVPVSPESPTPSGGGRLIHDTISTVKGKSWCWTLNNWTAVALQQLEALFATERVKYLVFGKEVCPTTGTPHLQGFVVFKDRKTFSQVRDVLPWGCHLEMKGKKSTMEEAAGYCRKDGQYKEFVNYF